MDPLVLGGFGADSSNLSGAGDTDSIRTPQVSCSENE